MPLDYLEKAHHHPRDAHVIFDEGPHTYTITTDPDAKYTSVTTWVHRHFEKFNSDKVITKMMASKNWPNNKYYGKTRHQIKLLWDANRDAAAAAGTKLHYDIECHYNKCAVTNDSVEYGYFKKFRADFKHLKPYRTEWMVYHEDYKLAGSIDMVFENPDGTLLIYDWKRCKEITKTTPWNKYAITPEIDYLPDTNFWHYSLQLNTYKKILEEKYDKKVTELYLVALHPDNKKNSYERLKVPNLQAELKTLLEGI